MKTWEWINIGDLHLEALSRVWGYTRGLKLQFKTLQSQIKLARQRNIKHVVMLGDIGHSPNLNDRTYIRLIKFFEQHQDLTFYIIAGNHDVENRQDTSLDIIIALVKLNKLPNVQVFPDHHQVKINGIPVVFQSWPHCQIPDQPSIVFAHVTFKGSLQENGYPTHSKLVFKDTQSYWIVGDIHRRQQLGKHVLYPGTIGNFIFGETQEKGITFSRATYSKNKLQVQHHFIPFKAAWSMPTLRVKDLTTSYPKNCYLRIIQFPKETLPTSPRYYPEKYIIDARSSDEKSSEIQSIESREFSLQQQVIRALKKLPVKVRKRAIRIFQQVAK